MENNRVLPIDTRVVLQHVELGDLVKGLRVGDLGVCVPTIGPLKGQIDKHTAWCPTIKWECGIFPIAFYQIERQ